MVVLGILPGTAVLLVRAIDTRRTVLEAEAVKVRRSIS